VDDRANLFCVLSSFNNGVPVKAINAALVAFAACEILFHHFGCGDLPSTKHQKIRAIVKNILGV